MLFVLISLYSASIPRLLRLFYFIFTSYDIKKGKSIYFKLNTKYYFKKLSAFFKIYFPMHCIFAVFHKLNYN